VLLGYFDGHGTIQTDPLPPEEDISRGLKLTHYRRFF
jgi:hypothetical protein